MKSRHGCEVPTWLWRVSPLLEDIFLFDNQITGTVLNLAVTSIICLDLRNNSISGLIPLFNKDVEIILMSGNMFSGSISSICNVLYGQFLSLYLSGNQLGEEIPNCWEKMPKLFSLNLGTNKFRGEIPPSLGSICDLAHCICVVIVYLEGFLPL